MTVRSSRFAEPISPGAGEARSIGWWAALFGAIALAHFVGALIVSYLYLRSGQEAWPPEGTELPGMLLPVVATLLTVLGAAVTTAQLKLTAAGRPVGALAAVVVAIMVGAAAVGTRVSGLLGLEFRWDDHAFGSLYWVLAGTQVALVAAAVVGSVATMAQHVLGLHDADRHDEVQVLNHYWWFAAISGLALYVTADLVSYL